MICFALTGWTVLETFDGATQVFYILADFLSNSVPPIVERAVLKSQNITMCWSISPFILSGFASHVLQLRCKTEVGLLCLRGLFIII